MKIIDIINKKVEEGKLPYYSFEYFPPKTERGVENLYDRLERMSALGPGWVDVTWGAGGSTSKLTVEICNTAHNAVGVETMMHLTCTNLPIEETKKALEEVKSFGMTNILALRGDPPHGQEWKQIEGGFAHGADLVRYIRKEYGDYFGICVAGYPEGHIESESYEKDLQYLKDKVDAGADLIITQLFYDCDIFLKFVKDCRALGIKIPIIPGIMPIHTYGGFMRMTSLCKTKVPQEIYDSLEAIKNDDEAVKGYGVKLCIEMCKKLLDNGVQGLHFYTLNLEKSIVQTLEGLNLIDPEMRRPLPWNTAPTRTKEDVRPIFWSHRPKSYIHRTSSWDEFPNGRWGDSRSPAFGDLTDYHLSALHAIQSEDKKKAWAESHKTEQDVWKVFSDYCNGTIPILPWCNTPLALESMMIKDQLVKLNNHGFLSINSQPKINGVSSTDDKVGWGPVGGYIYQKAYVEFFCSPKKLNAFTEAAKNHPTLQYHAVNLKGESFTSSQNLHVTAVTWGVFPGREIQQPTVVDVGSFLVWKDEAFALWQSQWVTMYEEGSESRKLLDDIVNSYYLVNVVDNNYIDGDIFTVFNEVIEKEGKQEA